MLETLSDCNIAPSGCSLERQPNHYRRRFPPQLELLRVHPNNSPNQRVHLDHLWTPSAQLRTSHFGLQMRKRITGQDLFVRYPPHPLRTLRLLISILHLCSQVAPKKTALIEYETTSIHSTTPTMNYWTSTNSMPS